MLPPPGLEPSLASLLTDVTTTSFLKSALTTSSSLLPSTTDLATSSSSTIAAIATAASTAISESSKGGSNGGPKEPPNGECNILGGFAILVQGALGILALSALVYKRWRERPQRPVKIWFFDVSKQVVGSVLVHIANLLMSMLSSGQFSMKVDPQTVSKMRRAVDENGKYQPNPCSFYLLNLAIDTTIGIPILIFLLRIFTALFARTPFGAPRESIESGNYGSPPKASWWAKQSLIYFLGLMGMKFCVLIIFLALPWISRVGDWALRWTEGKEWLQIMFVMLIFPVIMNATQYYIIDSFIKKQNLDQDHERIPDDDEGSTRDGPRYEDPGNLDESDLDEDPEVLAKADGSSKGSQSKGENSSSKSVRKPQHLKTGSKDYDPMFDGETSPTVDGSASTNDRAKLLDEDLDADKKSTR